MIASGVDWHLGEEGIGDGSFDGTVLRLLDPDYSAMESRDLCVETQTNGLPASFTMTARLQLDGADRQIFLWVEDPTTTSLLFGINLSGTAPDMSAPNDGGFYDIIGPTNAYADGLGGFDPDEDITVTLTWDAETGALTGRFEQGERVETLEATDDQDLWYELSGDWGCGSRVRRWPIRSTPGPSPQSTI